MARKTILFKGRQFDQNVSRLAGGWVGVQCPVQNGPQVQKWPLTSSSSSGQARNQFLDSDASGSAQKN